jgi:hypothetical protein
MWYVVWGIMETIRKEVYEMDKKVNILFGIIGSLLLIFIKHPLINFEMVLGGFRGFVTSFITTTLSIIGFLLMIYFCIILIWDALKATRR